MTLSPGVTFNHQTRALDHTIRVRVRVSVGIRVGIRVKVRVRIRVRVKVRVTVTVTILSPKTIVFNVISLVVKSRPDFNTKSSAAPPLALRPPRAGSPPFPELIPEFDSKCRNSSGSENRIHWVSSLCLIRQALALRT